MKEAFILDAERVREPGSRFTPIKAQEELATKELTAARAVLIIN